MVAIFIMCLILWPDVVFGLFKIFLCFVVLAVITSSLSFLFRSKTEQCPKCGEGLVPNFMTGGPASMECPRCQAEETYRKYRSE